jgi:hypothetical protein
MPYMEVIAWYYEQTKIQMKSDITNETRARYTLAPHIEDSRSLDIKMPIFPDEAEAIEQEDQDPYKLFDANGSLKQPTKMR